MLQSNKKLSENSLSGGYIVITTTIILGTILLLITLSTSVMIFFGRKDVLDNTAKAQSFFLARSCLERALNTFASNSSYTGNETFTIDSADQCTIQTIQSSPPNKIFTATAAINGMKTTLQLTVDANLNTVSYQEQ